MDIIFLGGLEIETIIGIYDWERETKQKVILDIEMAFNIKKAAEKLKTFVPDDGPETQKKYHE